METRQAIARTPAHAVDGIFEDEQSERMNIEQLEELVRGQPFEPFCLIMANGERLLVPHEDFIWLMPNRRVVQVALPNGASRWVDLRRVGGLEKPVASGKSGRRKRKRGH